MGKVAHHYIQHCNYNINYSHLVTLLKLFTHYRYGHQQP